MKRVGTLVVIAASLALSACGSSNDNNTTSSAAGGSQTSASSGNTIKANSANSSKNVTIGSKNFTEEYILGQIYAQALKAAGYNVKTQLNLGSEQIALKALKSGSVDAYPEYTGTALTSFFKVKNEDVPKDAQQAYEMTKDEFAKIGFTAMTPTPFTDSNGFAMTQEGAAKAGNVTKLSDLKAKASTLTLAGPAECAQRLDCKLGLEKVYKLKFKDFKSVDLAKR